MNFSNMSDGGSAGSIACTEIIVFSYQALQGSRLPLYVGEVNRSLLSKDEQLTLLQRLHYSFQNLDAGASSINVSQFHHIYIEGGEVAIEFICAGSQFLPATQ